MPLPSAEELLAEWTNYLRYHGMAARADSMAQQIVEYIFANEPLALPRELTSEEKADARAIFEGDVAGRSACRHCGGLHPGVAGLEGTHQPCPRVKSIKWHIDGVTILEVEYWPNGEWETDVVFPADVYEDDEDSK